MAQAQATAGPRTRKVSPAAGYEHASIAEVYDGYAATGNTTEWAYEQVQAPRNQLNTTTEDVDIARVEPLTSIRGLTQEQAESSGPNCRFTPCSHRILLSGMNPQGLIMFCTCRRKCDSNSFETLPGKSCCRTGTSSKV